MLKLQTNERILKWIFCAVCLWLIQAGGINSQTLKKTQTPENLRLNAALQKDFRSGSVDVFTIRSGANYLVEVELEQKGVDVLLTAIAPSGRIVREIDSPTQWFGRETLVFAASEAGDYKIEVKAARTGNFAGSYEIRLNVLRPLQTSDKARVDAFDSIYSTVDLMRRRAHFEAAKLTIERLKSAAVTFNEGSDSTSEASVLLWAGILYNRAGMRREAIELLEKSLELWRKIGDRVGEAAALSEAGITRHYLLEHEKAATYLDQAIAIRQSLLDRLGESATLTYQCRFYNNTGEFQKALESCRRANALRQDGDPAGAAATFNFIGIVHSSIGDYEKALFYFEQAAAQIPAAGNSLNSQTEAGIWANIGGVRYENKQYREALNFKNRALQIHVETGNLPNQAGALRDLGEIYRHLNQYQTALEYLRRSLKIYEQLDLPAQQDVLSTMGIIYGETKQTELARGALQAAINLNRINADRHALGDVLYSLARLENDNEQLIFADNYIKEAIKIYEFLRAKIISKNLRTAFVTTNLRKFYELQIEILLKLNRLNAERKFAAEALEAAEKSRARTLLEIISETGADLNRETDYALIERQRSMLDEIGFRDEKLWRESRKMSEAERAATESEIRRLSEDFNNLQEEIRRKNPAYAAMSEPQILTSREIQTQILDPETALVEYSLGERNSYAWVVTTENISVYKLPSRAQINPEAHKFYQLLARPEAAEAQQASAAARLQKMIIAPILAGLENHKRLLIVADGALQYIPFAALPSSQSKIQSPKSGKYLGANFEVIKLPSVSTLAALRRLKKPEAQNLLAVMADPIFAADDERLKQNSESETSKAGPESSDLNSILKEVPRSLSDTEISNLARLPFTRREGEFISAEAGKDQTMLAVGFEASRRRVISGELGNYRVLHFATHGLFNSKRPEMSGLALSFFDEQGKPVNGFLRAQDIYNLRLRADLVVLSACQTAYGKEVEGEGLISLTRSFMYAGAERVVASLWKVDDAATAEFMRRFYRAMFKDGKNTSAALQQAQTEIRQIKRWQNPRYWASFVLQGDWK
jgi:CHAT domain-containing protein